MRKDLGGNKQDGGESISFTFGSEHLALLGGMVKGGARGNYDEDILGALSLFVVESSDPQLLFDDPSKLLWKARSIASTLRRKLVRRAQPVKRDKLHPDQFPSVVVEGGEEVAVNHRNDERIGIEECSDFYGLWALLRPALTPIEEKVLSVRVSLAIWHRESSAANVAECLKKTGQGDMTAESVRQHLSEIRRKAQGIQERMRWNCWQEFISQPNLESAERYITSLGPKRRCPFRWAGIAGVLGSSLGKRPLREITPQEAAYAHNCAFHARKLTQADLSQGKRKLHALFFANGIYAYTQLLRAHTCLIDWDTAKNACKEEIRRTANRWAALGFEYAYLLARVARILGRDNVADEIQMFSGCYVISPGDFAKELDIVYSTRVISPEPRPTWLIDDPSNQ